MGIFSSDEDPSWTDVINYQGKIEELEQENRKLKEKLAATKFYNCGETFLTPEGAELYEENVNYKEALEEILGIIQPIACDKPEDCGMNEPDWNGEVYGCDPEREIKGCPSSLALVIRNVVRKVLK